MQNQYAPVIAGSSSARAVKSVIWSIFFPETWDSFSTNHDDQETFVSLSIRVFSCSICGKKFNRNDNLKVHERIHTGRGRYSCNYCDYSANQLIHVKQHTVHKHTREFPHLCSCGKGFTSQYRLKLHQMTVHCLQ
ncbi:UNVERIFIED_CONTAM: Tissue-resident T-cell transcription regulator protein [Trichonephila clavipes]